MAYNLPFAYHNPINGGGFTRFSESQKINSSQFRSRDNYNKKINPWIFYKSYTHLTATVTLHDINTYEDNMN